MDSKDLIEWLGSSKPTDYLSSIGLVVSGAFIAWKYWTSKRVERSQCGSAVLRELESDEWLKLACQMLDWTARKFRLAEPIACNVVSAAEDETPVDPEAFIHSTGRMTKALSLESMGFSPVEVLYRDVFDRFFTYLERVNAALESRLFEARDIRPLAYYLEALFEPQHHGPEAGMAMISFIDKFYDGDALRRLRVVLRKA